MLPLQFLVVRAAVSLEIASQIYIVKKDVAAAVSV